MKPGDLVVLQGKLCATSFSGRLGFIVGLGQPAPRPARLLDPRPRGGHSVLRARLPQAPPMKVGDLVWIRSEVGMIVNVRNEWADVLIGGEVRLFYVESLTEWLDLI